MNVYFVTHNGIPANLLSMINAIQFDKLFNSLKLSVPIICWVQTSF